MCGKVGYFIKDYWSNMVRKDETLIIITKQFNITIKEYPIEALDGESKSWEEVLRILDIKKW